MRGKLVGTAMYGAGKFIFLKHANIKRVNSVLCRLTMMGMNDLVGTILRKHGMSCS